MGYCQDPNTYKLWDNARNKFLRSKNVIFNEKLEGNSQSTILPISLAPPAESAPHSDNSNASDDNVADQNADNDPDDVTVSPTQTPSPIREVPTVSSPVNQSQEKMTKVTNIQEPRKSCRIRKPPERFLQYQCNHTTQKVNKVTKNTQKVNKVP